MTRLLWAGVAGILVLSPVWIAPALPTTDGPSHVYNARVERAVAEGRDPYVGVHFLRTEFGPNQASRRLLAALGPLVGWTAAEQTLISLAVAAQFVGVLLLAGSVAPSAVVLSALLTQSWFLWMGFFDFALSLALFAGLAAALTRTTGTSRVVVLGVLLAGLFFTHLFTFAAGLGLVLGFGVWHLIRREPAAPELITAAPALWLLMRELASGGRVGGLAEWGSPVKAALGLLIGDVLVTLHPGYLLVGIAVMIGVWTTMGSVGAMAFRQGIRSLDPLSAAGGAVLLLSLVVPDAVGEGTYVQARMRFFGVVLVAPRLLESLARLRPGVRRGVVAAGFLVLILNGGRIVAAGNQVDRDARALVSSLKAMGAKSGDWVLTHLTDNERGLFRISAYEHLGPRVAAELDLVVLDNYEAYVRTFPVAWRNVPDQLVIRPESRVWHVSRKARELCPGGSVHVIHDSGAELRFAQPEGSIESVHPVGRGTGMAVTSLRVNCVNRER